MKDKELNRPISYRFGLTCLGAIAAAACLIVGCSSTENDQSRSGEAADSGRYEGDPASEYCKQYETIFGGSAGDTPEGLQIVINNVNQYGQQLRDAAPKELVDSVTAFLSEVELVRSTLNDSTDPTADLADPDSDLYSQISSENFTLALEEMTAYNNDVCAIELPERTADSPLHDEDDSGSTPEEESQTSTGSSE